MDTFGITEDDLTHFRKVFADVMKRLEELEDDIITIDRVVQKEFHCDPIVKQYIHNSFMKLKQSLDSEIGRLIK